MMPVSISSQGAWQSAATTFFWSKNARIQHLVVDAQEIGIDLTAGQHDGVVIINRRICEAAVDLHRAPFSGDTTSTLASASFNCASGTSSSDCSNPWVARIATRLPESFIFRLHCTTPAERMRRVFGNEWAGAMFRQISAASGARPQHDW